MNGGGGGGGGGRGHDEAGTFRRGHQRKGKPSRRQSHAGERVWREHTLHYSLHTHPVYTYIQYIQLCGAPHIYTDIKMTFFTVDTETPET